MARILLADDLHFVKVLQREYISEMGHEIVGDASDGLQAVELYQKTKPDILILDLTMPKMDGITALQKIMELDPQAKVIICSALGQQNVIVEAIQSGAIEFIIKPFTKERIQKAVECTLKII